MRVYHHRSYLKRVPEVPVFYRSLADLVEAEPQANTKDYVRTSYNGDPRFVWSKPPHDSSPTQATQACDAGAHANQLPSQASNNPPKHVSKPSKQTRK